MPRYIAKLAENKYVEWSTIVDAPVTYILTRDHMLANLDIVYGTSSFEENRERMERADKNGTSCLTPMSAEDLIDFNRAGEDEENITLEQILEKYDLKNQKADEEKWEKSRHGKKRTDLSDGS